MACTVKSPKLPVVKRLLSSKQAYWNALYVMELACLRVCPPTETSLVALLLSLVAVVYVGIWGPVFSDRREEWLQNSRVARSDQVGVK